MLPTDDQEALAARRSLRGKSPAVKAPAYDHPARRRRSNESNFLSMDDSMYGDGGREWSGSEYCGRSEDYESDPDDATPINPFGRPLPKSHASRRKSRVLPSPESNGSPNAEGGGGGGKLVLKLAAITTDSKAGRQDREERMTATTAPSTNVSSMIVPGRGSMWWEGLKNSVLGKGLEQESIRDLHIFRRSEEGRHLSKSEHGEPLARQSRGELHPHSEQSETGNASRRSGSELRSRSNSRGRNKGNATASAAFMSAAAEAFMEAGSMGDDEANAMASSRATSHASISDRSTFPGQMDVDFPNRRRSTGHIGKQPWRASATSAAVSGIPKASEHSSEAWYMATMALDATTTGAKRSLKDEALRARAKRDKRMERAVAKSNGYSHQTPSQKEMVRSRGLQSPHTTGYSQHGSISKPCAPGFSDKSKTITEAERRRAERLAEWNAELNERWDDKHVAVRTPRHDFDRMEDAADDWSVNRRIWRGIDSMLNDAFSVTQGRDDGRGASRDNESNRNDDDRSILLERDRVKEMVRRLGDEISFAAGTHGDDHSIVSRLSMHTWRRSQRSLAPREVSAKDKDQDELEMAQVALDSFVDFFSQQNLLRLNKPGSLTKVAAAGGDSEYQLSYVEAVRADADAVRRSLSGNLPPGLANGDNNRSWRSQMSLKARSTLHSSKSMVGKKGVGSKRSLPRKSLEELSSRIFASGMNASTNKSTWSLGSRSIGRSSETTSGWSPINAAAAAGVLREVGMVRRARSTNVALTYPQHLRHVDEECTSAAEMEDVCAKEYEHTCGGKYRDEVHDCDNDEEAQSIAKDLHNMDDVELAQTALESFVDVLLGESPEHDDVREEADMPEEPVVAMRSSQARSVHSMYSHCTSESKATGRSTYSITDDIDVPTEKVSKLSGPSKTLFEVFRWSLRVNIDHAEKLRRRKECQIEKALRADREEEERLQREKRSIYRRTENVIYIDRRIRTGLPTVYASGDEPDSAANSIAMGSSPGGGIGGSGYESSLVSEVLSDGDDERTPSSRDKERIHWRQSYAENNEETELEVLKYAGERESDNEEDCGNIWRRGWRGERAGNAVTSKPRCKRSQEIELLDQILNHSGGTVGEELQRSCSRTFLSRFGRPSRTAPRVAPSAQGTTSLQTRRGAALALSEAP